MMCKVLCKQFLQHLTNRNSTTKRSLHRALFHASKSLRCKATYAQLRYLTNTAAVPQVTATEIKSFLKNKGFTFEEGYACLHLPCPLCATEGNREKTSTMYINKITGAFICYSCKCTGNWNLLEKYTSSGKKSLKLPNDGKSIFLSEEEEKELQRILHSSCNISDLSEKELLALSKEFPIEGLSYDCLKSFDVKVTTDHRSLLLPIYGFDCKITGMYMLSVPHTPDLLFNYSVFPRKEIAALFGGSRASDSTETVLTSSPLDAMAVSQQTGVPGICIPQSISSLPNEILPLMENFKKIIIWVNKSNQDERETTLMGESSHLADSQKETPAITLAKAIGENRCHFVYSRNHHSTPLVCLQNNESISSELKKAHPSVHQSTVMPHSLRKKLYAAVYSKEAMGVKWNRFPALNHLLKGFRRGELTLFTGPTGSGKTTFISEYSLDLCMQGVNTLWGSFEINNEHLLKIMLTQFAQLPLGKNEDKFDYWADKFEQLPLYLMTFHGEASLSNVIDAMTHAVNFNNVQHVVIDNVQFMLGTSDMSSSLDRFWQQDKLITSFRRFATLHNCHVTLVMHPRKEKETEELNNNSIFGGAKASQEADNILILQDKRTNPVRGKKYLQLTKNRFGGDLGIMSLEFDKETLSFAMKKKQKKSQKKVPVEGDSSSQSASTDENDVELKI